jgi:hypothetical protein
MSIAQPVAPPEDPEATSAIASTFAVGDRIRPKLPLGTSRSSLTPPSTPPTVIHSRRPRLAPRPAEVAGWAETHRVQTRSWGP